MTPAQAGFFRGRVVHGRHVNHERVEGHINTGLRVWLVDDGGRDIIEVTDLLVTDVPYS